MPKVDARSIEALYRAHGHSVLRRARLLLGNEDDARDVLHEVFASMLDDAAAFRGESSLTTWLYSAATHGCLNRIRNQATRTRLLAEQHRGEPLEASNAETATIVRELLGSVPEELAQVVIHYHVDEMTHEEIALVLGCSRRHVGDLVERLHATLRAVEDVQ